MPLCSQVQHRTAISQHQESAFTKKCCKFALASWIRVEFFPWSCVNFLHNISYLLLTDVRKASILWNVLHNEPIYILNGPFLPWWVRIGKIDLCSNALCNHFVACEFRSVVSCEPAECVHYYALFRVKWWMDWHLLPWQCLFSSFRFGVR